MEKKYILAVMTLSNALFAADLMQVVVDGSKSGSHISADSGASSTVSNPLRLNLFGMLTGESTEIEADSQTKRAIKTCRKLIRKETALAMVSPRNAGLSSPQSMSSSLSRSASSSDNSSELDESSRLNAVLSQIEVCSRVLINQEIKAEEDRSRAAQQLNNQRFHTKAGYVLSLFGMLVGATGAVVAIVSIV